MKSLYWHVSVVFFVFLVSCQQQPTTLTEAQKAEIVEQVTARQTEFIKTASAVDAEAFFELLSQDDFVAYVTIDHYLNRQTFLDSVNTWLAQRETQQFDQNTLKIYPLTSDLAIADVNLGGRMTMKDGIKWKGINVITFIWQREPTGWYITHYNESWRYNKVIE